MLCCLLPLVDVMSLIRLRCTAPLQSAEMGRCYLAATWYAVNGENGSLVWSFLTQDAVQVAPVVGADGSVYFFGGPPTATAIA